MNVFNYNYKIIFNITTSKGLTFPIKLLFENIALPNEQIIKQYQKTIKDNGLSSEWDIVDITFAGYEDVTAA